MTGYYTVSRMWLSIEDRQRVKRQCQWLKAKGPVKKIKNLSLGLLPPWKKRKVTVVKLHYQNKTELTIFKYVLVYFTFNVVHSSDM